MKAVVKVDIVDGKCVVIYSDGSEQELYEYPSDEGSGGGEAVLGTKNITANGSYTARNDGYDGYSKVNVNVPSSAVLGTKMIGANGVYNASADNLDGFSSVDVRVIQPPPVLARKTITENGVYNASDDHADGFEQVTVNVSSGGGVDFTDAISSYENRSFGSLFGSISEGKFGAIQKIVTSGMNPIEVQFPANITLKGILIYPINVALEDLNNEGLIISVTMLSDTFDEETGNQSVSWAVYRAKGSSLTGSSIANRMYSWQVKDNKLTLVPNFPSNQTYNPFKFGSKYAFAYWY